MELATELQRASAWLRGTALPLWAGRGFDTEYGSFHEQLDFDLQPVPETPQRVMVQARQIAVFSAAALSGQFAPGAQIALTAAENMIRRYEGADGAPGWVFSLGGADRQAINPQRDLYALAFVLFSLSWAIRLEPRRHFIEAIDRTIEFLETRMRDAEHGGYWDALPRPDALRRQNPHMHLFEAYIALFEATGEARFLTAGGKLRDLMEDRLLAPDSGALREFFHDDWSVHPAEGAGSVEPGHLFEWAWLLTRYEAISGTEQSSAVGRLMALAIQAGLDTGSGRIIDEIAEDGTALRGSSRSWPHAEALKAFCAVRADLGGQDTASISALLQRLMSVYCPQSLRGGWHDQMDEHDRPVRPNIPASSLYHIYFGITSVEDAYGEHPGG